MKLRRRSLAVAAAGGVALSMLGAVSALGQSDQAVGPRADGTAVAPTGHRVTPAGRQTALGDLPLGSALSPDGRTLLVSNDGQGAQSLQVVDVASGRVLQTLTYASPASLLLGVAFSPDGSTAYASGAEKPGSPVLRRYTVAGQSLAEQPALPVPGAKLLGGLAITPDGARAVVTDVMGDAVDVVDIATGSVSSVGVGHRPRSVTLGRNGGQAWITDQGGSDVTVLDVSGAAPSRLATVPVGTHPVAAALDPAGRRLYVADAESDDVVVLDTATRSRVSAYSLGQSSSAPVGVNPSDLALSADGKLLYVAAAGRDAVLVIDTASGRTLGAMPSGWYPTAVEVTGDRLLVANGKGLGAGPNNGPGHPDPTSPSPTAPNQYAGSMMVGTLSAIALPLSADDLARGAKQVSDNNGYAASRSSREAPSGVQHVIYVVQENRTFDQVFGDLGKGNGDASLNLFGDESAPNQRALQRQYVTFDNFFADAEISAQGWNWSTAAGSPLYTEQLWPSNYSGRGAPYPSESNDPATAPNRNPADAYLWDKLADKGVSFRNYGFYVNTDATGYSKATDPVLDDRTDHAYRGYDLSCPDNADTFTPLKSGCGTPRFDEWKREFDGFVDRGDLPTVELVRLPNDHTAGTRPGSPTPRAYVADNDLALGRLVDAVTHSPYGRSTAIVVTEDDAQNGPDHVDAHRTLAQLISPWTRTGAVDSTLYSTTSMLRTIEDLVGIAPLTRFDAESSPMTASFARSADLTAYDAVRPREAGDARNASTAPMAAASAALPLQREDLADPLVLNEAIWQSVRGARSVMPVVRGVTGD